jgi:hypothetical protein
MDPISLLDRDQFAAPFNASSLQGIQPLYANAHQNLTSGEQRSDLIAAA